MAYIGSFKPQDTAAGIGSSLGQGIGEGVNALLSNHVNKLQERQAYKGFKEAGYTDQEAKLFSMYHNNPGLFKLLQNREAPTESQQNGLDKQPISNIDQSQMGLEQNALQSLLGNQQLRLRQSQNQVNNFDPQRDFLNSILQRIPGVNDMLRSQQQHEQAQQIPTQALQRAPISQTVQQQQQPSAKPSSRAPSFKKSDLAQEKLQNQNKTRIERVNKPYNDALDKRITSAEEILDKGNLMLGLLEKGDVDFGFTGKYKPNVFQNADSQEFDSLGDDAAAALSGLQSGVQTISKIKFNKERKANLGQNRETQLRRVKDMNKMAEKILLEGDIRGNLVETGNQPENLSSKVQKNYEKLKNDIPDVPENAQIGEEFVDPKSGAIWVVSGNRMRFNGFAQRR